MANEDVLSWAMSNLFIGLFVSGTLTLAMGGSLLLTTNAGVTINNYFQQGLFDTQRQTNIVEDATPTVNTQDMVNKADNPLIFDIVLGMINVAALIVSIFAIIGIILVNYFILPFWLMTAGVPGFIVALIWFVWQMNTWRYLIQFILKDRIRVK